MFSKEYVRHKELIKNKAMIEDVNGNLKRDMCILQMITTR